ncbi:MAG TPA: PilZ domain-containing protein [Spirochaetia bacterium]|nr:PilZ domain-containing protein [Spirochaetia bacterium]
MEGRHEERKQIIYYLRVFDADSGSPLGHVANLSAHGFMVRSELQLKKGKTMLVRLDLPKSMNGPLQLELKTRVKWSRPDPDSSFFKTGLGLMHVSKNDEKTLADLIQNFLYEEPPEEEELDTAGR